MSFLFYKLISKNEFPLLQTKVTILSWAQSYVFRNSPQCQRIEHAQVVPFNHKGLRASLVTYRGSQENSQRLSKKNPAANILYVGGLGSNFDCTIHRCMLLAYEFFKLANSKQYINLYVFDHLTRTTVSDIVDDTNALQNRIRSEMPEVPLWGFGHSMGTGILLESIQVCSYDAIVLQNPQNRTSDLVKEYNLQNWESFMLGAPFRNDINIQKIHSAHNSKLKIVIVSNRHDNTIPFQNQIQLVQAAQQNSNLKLLWIRLNGDHSQYLSEPSIRITFEFLQA